MKHLKPDWKKYAKESWHRGYDRALKDSSDWNLPYEDPPKESGTYICLLGKISGNTLTVRLGFADFDAESKQFYLSPLCMDSIILRWMPTPPIPEALLKRQILKELASAKPEKT